MAVIILIDFIFLSEIQIFIKTYWFPFKLSKLVGNSILPNFQNLKISLLLKVPYRIEGVGNLSQSVVCISVHKDRRNLNFNVGSGQVEWPY